MRACFSLTPMNHTRTPRKVFISHSTSDKALADLLQALIETGIGLAHNEVFCTSLEGLGITDGTPDFKEYIRVELEGCDTVVALISPNYYASPFCMCELGAVWVLAKNFFPILVPPIDFKDLRGVLVGMQCRKLVDQGTASALYTRLSKLIPNPVPIERWDIKKEIFYKSLSGVLTGLPKPQIATREELLAVTGERERYKELSVQLQEECDLLKRKNKDLESAKDANEVAEIRKKYSSEWQQYEAIVEACRSSLGQVSRIVKEAVFYWARDEAYRPPAGFDDEVTKAIENDLITPDRFDPNTFWPNDERPAVTSD
jgi:hypothetical protein